MKIMFAALSTLLVATALPLAAQAQAAPSTTFSIGAVTDYRYRGITQSRFKPALQGGADYNNPNGIYLGTWLSTIKWTKDAGGGGDVEVDLYGGYKGELVKDVAFDVGGLYYVYPNNKLGNLAGFVNANTFEIYGAVTFGPITAKYSHSLTNTFAFVNSKNSGYLDVSASFDLGNGFSLAPHVGHQRIKGSVGYSYTDYSLTLGKDMGSGFTLSLAAVGTDADKNNYITPASDGKKFTGKSALVLGGKYSF